MSYDYRNKEDVEAFMAGEIKHLRHFMYLSINYAAMESILNWDGKPIKQISLN